MISKKYHKNYCVAVVTIKWTVTEGDTKTTWEESVGATTHYLTDKDKIAIKNQVLKVFKGSVLSHRAEYGIKEDAQVKFYAGIKIIECDYISNGI